MKIILKYFYIVAFIVSTYSGLRAQICAGTVPPSGPPAAYTPNWNWLDATPINWYGNISTGTLSMGSPFINGTNTDDMVNITDGLDYKPEQGWVLLAKDFGVISGSNANNATPYFMLYNKYRSIVRVFMYYGNSSINVNKASVILKWGNASTNYNSLLTFANNYALANENYSITTTAEKHINYLNQVSYSGAWGVTEFLVNFDPNTVKSVGNFQNINFDFKLSSAASVSLTGDFSFSTESATTKNPPAATVNGSNSSLLDYVVSGKKALAKAPKKSELVDGFNTIASKVNDIDEKFCNDFTRDLGNLNNSLQTGKLKEYLLGAAQLGEDIGGVLGVAGKVLELFVSKSNTATASSAEAYVQPTISKGTMNLNGTIITESNPLSITLQLPGTSHKYADGTINCPNLPIYDCPMGVISMQEAPTLSVRTWTETERSGYFDCSIQYGMASNVGCTPIPPAVTENTLGACGPGNSIFLFKRTQYCAASFPIRTVKSYKVTGDIKLALNAVPGVVIESTKAALYFEIKDNGSGAAAFDLMQTTTTPTLCLNPLTLVPSSCGAFNANACFANGTTAWNPVTNFVETKAYFNYAKSALNKGTLKLSDYDLTSGFHKFQTPFIDIDKFKNTAITMQEGCNVYLKLLITMRPTNLNDDQTPIIHIVTYQFPQNKLIADNTPSSLPYVETCAQRIGEDTTLIGTSGSTLAIGNVSFAGVSVRTASNSNITANPTGTTNVEAYSIIKLRPEFKTQLQPGGMFTARLNQTVTGCATANNALIVQTYTYNCPGSGANNRFAQVTEQAKDEEGFNKLTIAEEMQNLNLKIAPNPNSGSFNLLFNKKVNSGTVKIYNSIGQEVYSQILANDSDAYELDLNEYLTRGAYYLSWNNATFVIKQKFIVN